MCFFQRILRILLKSGVSLHTPSGWVWPGQPTPSCEWKQQWGETAWSEHREYSPFTSGNITFYGFFLACICSLFMFCALFPQEATCRAFPLGFSWKNKDLKKINSIFQWEKESGSCWEWWNSLDVTETPFLLSYMLWTEIFILPGAPQGWQGLGWFPSLLLQEQPW